jgi:hypothetical protein
VEPASTSVSDITRPDSFVPLGRTGLPRTIDVRLGLQQSVSESIYQRASPNFNGIKALSCVSPVRNAKGSGSRTVCKPPKVRVEKTWGDHLKFLPDPSTVWDM